ncbi:MAG: hypothetical protein LIO75_08930 [Lachnospiraceae bacterium]|nr:hypothetical protein [Lachnospiraceae bacterium]
MDTMIKKIRIFRAKGEPGTPLSEVRAVSGHGLEGDRHGMDEQKPISLSDAGIQDWNRTQEYDALCFHRFKTNLTLEGLGQLSLKPGDRIRIGDQVVLEISSAFKKCYREQCELYNHGIVCPLPGNMLFAVCRAGGVIREGDAVRCVREPWREVPWCSLPDGEP